MGLIMSKPPQLDMTMAQAHVYIEKMEHVTISLMTVYNWAVRGKRGSILQTKMKLGQRFTTQKWIREFIHNVR